MILSEGTGTNSYTDARLSNQKDSPPVRRRYERVDRVGKISIDPSSVRYGDMAGNVGKEELGRPRIGYRAAYGPPGLHALVLRNSHRGWYSRRGRPLFFRYRVVMSSVLVDSRRSLRPLGGLPPVRGIRIPIYRIRLTRMRVSPWVGSLRGGLFLRSYRIVNIGIPSRRYIIYRSLFLCSWADPVAARRFPNQ